MKIKSLHKQGTLILVTGLLINLQRKQVVWDPSCTDRKDAPLQTLTQPVHCRLRSKIRGLLDALVWLIKIKPCKVHFCFIFSLFKRNFAAFYPIAHQHCRKFGFSFAPCLRDLEITFPAPAQGPHCLLVVWPCKEGMAGRKLSVCLLELFYL